MNEQTKGNAMARCDACKVYEATCTVSFLKLTVRVCHACLVAFRHEAKQEFKRSETSRPKPPRRKREER